MKKIAEFMKVSFDIYKDSMKKEFDINEETAMEFYNQIKLPTRATTGSAGYDFKLPFTLTLKPNETKKIPTGIRCKMSEGWVLLIFPRSGLGFKYRMGLDNTVGVIDSDYFNSDNEGHIILKVTNNTLENKTLELEKDKGICQGIFMEFGITMDDDVTDIRNGGFGSTNK